MIETGRVDFEPQLTNSSPEPEPQKTRMNLLKLDDGQKIDGLSDRHEVPKEVKFKSYEDPIAHLGYGAYSYFKILTRLMCLFLFVTILHIPIFKYYSSWNVPVDIKTAGNDSIYSLGNMGSAKTRCELAQVAAKHVFMGCKTGKITAITHFGLY